MTDILERLSDRMRGKTHWEGCEEEHDDCAAYREIERLRDVLRFIEVSVGAERAALDKWHSWMTSRPHEMEEKRDAAILATAEYYGDTIAASPTCGSLQALFALQDAGLVSTQHSGLSTAIRELEQRLKKDEATS